MRTQHGFTLLEITIVLLVVGLLLTSLMPQLSQQIELSQRKQTEQKLALAQQALLGFAISNGRLPCPASSTSQGQESFCTQDTGNCSETLTLPSHGKCAKPFDGLLPAASLALNQANNNGYLLDSWQRPIRYAVANNKINNISNALTRPDGIKTASINSINNANLLFLCYDAGAISTTDCGTSTNKFSEHIPAIIYSLGANPNNIGPSSAANQDNNKVFILHTTKMTSNDLYDDQVSWLSLNTLFYQMINAKVLP